MYTFINDVLTGFSPIYGFIEWSSQYYVHTKIMVWLSHESTTMATHPIFLGPELTIGRFHKDLKKVKKMVFITDMIDYPT